MRGVIAAGHRLTAEAGADVLRSGGSAIDATIAALAMACVCEPVLCSPGGGGFAMIRGAQAGEVSVIDFFPHTPLRRGEVAADAVREVFADFGTATQGFHIGPGTSATPGFVAGIDALVAAGATRSLGDLVAQAAGASRAGVVVTEFQHHLSTVVAPILTATPSASSLFAPDGELVPVGGLLRNPGVGDVLESIADPQRRGSDVVSACVDAQRGRGHLSDHDFVRYEVARRAPLSLPVGDATVHLNPLPSAGGVLVAHTLRQLESASPAEIADALRQTGAARRAAAGDLAALADAPIRPRGTTHVSVVDADGTACAVTVSNGEGNGEIVGQFGFMLNNVLGEEDVNPAGADRWPPDTRLSSMMCPTIIERADGTLTALGSGGSNRIRSAIAQVVARLTLGDEELADAVHAPRLHVEEEHLDLERGFDEETVAALVERFTDHRVWPDPDLFFGGVHSVQRSSGGHVAAIGDRRRDGHAIVVD